MVQNQLSGIDVTVVEPTTLSADDLLQITADAERLRKLAGENQATHVIWGTLQWEAEQFRLTAFLLETEGQADPSKFFSAGDSIEDLSGAVQELSANIGKKLVKLEKIVQLLVEGNIRIEDDAILRVVSSKVGDDYIPKKLSNDLKAVYGMGYFDDIRVESQDNLEGKIITFQVKEKSTIKTITFKGNKAIKSEDLQENLDISTGSILNIFAIRKNMKRIELQYKEKNYHHVRVTYETESLKNNQVALTFLVEEGEKIRIKHIDIEGNTAYKTKKLKKMIKTSEKGFFSWITSSGEYKEDVLGQDIAILGAFYQNNGFVEVKIADPVITVKDNWIDIIFKIEEGSQYKAGTAEVAGDLVEPEEALLARLKITEEEYFNRDMVRKDVLMLTDVCSNYGYAFADVTPRIRKHKDTKVVDITYHITKHDKVYFEKIIITGNTKTRDKVIRRELRVHEQGLFSGGLMKRSVRNLNRLNFFEDVKVNTYKGEADDTMVLKLEVEEKSTGAFSFGGGYSSVENLFLTGSISQDNFLGRGQSITLQAQLGSRTTQFNLRFVEPWLFDIPLSAGINIYNWTRDYDSYDKKSMGGSLSASYPFFKEDVRLFGSYRYDIGEVENVFVELAPVDIVDLEGTFVTSSVTFGISYDTRDRILNPTRGQDHNLTVEYAGLGGDIGFTKVTAELGIYIPLFWKVVGFIHGKGGIVSQNSGLLLPDYERFYLGGINSIRGFDWRDIHLLDENGNETGGERMIQINLELIVPLVKAAGINGVIFFDTGQVFGEDDDIDIASLRQTAGFGVRWNSPMGPIRLEYGHILDPEDSDSGAGQWEFTMGSAF
ncbi:MAG: outer membrane protein assembly factor BamA [Deltaproteobacteria bacterium]|nr:outer membrane protein assembly factor BamA [Deltaproteobacteria bacterium]